MYRHGDVGLTPIDSIPEGAIPEKRKVQYVLVDTAKILSEIPVTKEDLQGFYDQHRDDYRVPEQVSVRTGCRVWKTYCKSWVTSPRIWRNSAERW